MFGIDAMRKARRWAADLREPGRAAALQGYYDTLLDALNARHAGTAVDALAMAEAIATVLSQMIEGLRPVDRRRLLVFLATRAEALAQGRVLQRAPADPPPRESPAPIALPAGTTEH